MSWVMDRALPEDVPIEARMVTRAIEKAQATVEQKNAEIRKDVLKYDEVMNEQRKVIYERRMQVIDGDDLRERTVELLEEKIAALVATSCPSEYSEEWDLARLVAELRPVLPDPFQRRRPRPGGEHRAARRQHLRRGDRVLRGRTRRTSPAASRPRGTSSARSCCRSSTSDGGTTSPRWTTCARGSTCAASPRPTRSSPGSARASRCSAC